MPLTGAKNGMNLASHGLYKRCFHDKVTGDDGRPHHHPDVSQRKRVYTVATIAIAMVTAAYLYLLATRPELAAKLKVTDFLLQATGARNLKGVAGITTLAMSIGTGMLTNGHQIEKAAKAEREREVEV
ncbi:hypothetical protein SCG7109_AN_00150 [Chlamydiales bacterium SCGC AG-110-M15]|nr:hypothetical protein SCG7109_AN_00150 [Chlamydiales bacterium SCGC AG-110-M15]